MTTLTMNHQTDATQADPYAEMVEFITATTAAWWSYLTGLTPEFCGERFTTELARSLARDVYAHQVDEGASDADAIAAAGVVVVRNTMVAVGEERAAQLTAELRDHVRRSVTQV
ncbi:hypothetical protein [Streptomyces sp. NPDC097610]|uniref:hypothetical protein n=1 Tax=Streptomyces sp. NPDC097610 TaxID=3157227 RepID=UPI00332DC40C